MLIQSIQRALGIMNLFTIATPRLGLTEISHTLGIHKATTQGLVRTLLSEGYLEQDPDTKKYCLGLKIYELGVVLAGSLEINQKAVDPAHRLSLDTQLMVRVCLLDGWEGITTLDVYPRTQPFLVRQLGVRFPLYCTAMGKALLAFLTPKEIEEYLDQVEFFSFTPKTVLNKDDLLKELEQVRRLGYSINREEHLQARAAIGAPIFNANCRPVASTSLVGDPKRILGKELDSLAKKIVSMAIEVSQSMGFYPFPFRAAVHNRQG